MKKFSCVLLSRSFFQGSERLLKYNDYIAVCDTDVYIKWFRLWYNLTEINYWNEKDKEFVCI